MSSTAPLARLPRFFLAAPPCGAVAELAPGEEEHARRVLRLEGGERVLGLDGAGGAWLLELAGARGARALEELEREPEPGEPGAPLPRIEVAVSWPRKTRGEPMLGALCQLGAAAITPLRARQGGAERIPDAAPERWWKIVREACKQSGRTWLPELLPPVDASELAAARAGAALALLDPCQGMSMDTWVRSLLPALGGLGSRDRPVVLAIGPEGGFDEEERGALLAGGATAVRLSPHVLRIETAALAALAVCACGLAALAPRP